MDIYGPDGQPMRLPFGAGQPIPATLDLLTPVVTTEVHSKHRGDPCFLRAETIFSAIPLPFGDLANGAPVLWQTVIHGIGESGVAVPLDTHYYTSLSAATNLHAALIQTPRMIGELFGKLHKASAEVPSEADDGYGAHTGHTPAWQAGGERGGHWRTRGAKARGGRR